MSEALVPNYLLNDFNMACLRAVVKLLDRLQLRSHDPSNTGDDAILYVSRLFNKYSTALLTSLEICQSEVSSPFLNWEKIQHLTSSLEAWKGLRTWFHWTGMMIIGYNNHNLTTCFTGHPCLAEGFRTARTCHHWLGTFGRGQQRMRFQTMSAPCIRSRHSQTNDFCSCVRSSYRSRDCFRPRR